MSPGCRSLEERTLKRTSAGGVKVRGIFEVWCGAVVAAALLGTAHAADQAEYPALPASPPPAAPVEQSNRFAAGVGIGTLGLGAEFSAKLNEWMVVRLDGGGYSLSLSRNIQGNNYSLQPSLIDAGLFADWHPFANGFRVSAGPTFQNLQISGSAVPAAGSTVAINGNTYQSSQIGTLHAAMTDNKVGGYLGIGYDAIHYAPGHFGVSFDVGAIYAGSPKINLSTDKSVPGLATDLAAAQSSIQNSLKYLGFYPVVAVTAKYGF